MRNIVLGLMAVIFLFAPASWANDAPILLGGKEWSLARYAAKLQEKIDATPRLKNYLVESDWVGTDCTATPLRPLVRAGDHCLRGPVYTGGSQYRFHIFALLRVSDSEESIVQFVLPETSNCGLFASNAGGDETNIREAVELTRNVESWGRVKVVKNAHVLNFVSSGANCVGFRDYGTPLFTPGSQGLYRFTSVGCSCSNAGNEPDKSRTEALLRTYQRQDTDLILRQRR